LVICVSRGQTFPVWPAAFTLIELLVVIAVLESHSYVHPAGFRQAQPALYRLLSCPGGYHNGLGSFSSADGHVEAHRWLDACTQPRLVRDHNIALSSDGVSSPNNPDVGWLRAGTFQSN
jgi:hypothetical protein